MLLPFLDLITLYNYGNNKGTTEVINTYAYLLAADAKLKSIDKQYYMTYSISTILYAI